MALQSRIDREDNKMARDFVEAVELIAAIIRALIIDPVGYSRWALGQIHKEREYGEWMGICPKCGCDVWRKKGALWVTHLDPPSWTHEMCDG
jgi:putative AlgH/UPF0301 family transcriptional regulator